MTLARSLPLLVLVLSVVTLSPVDALAQKPTLQGAAGAGTGASFGQGDGATVVMLSPVFMDADIIVGNDERPKLEYVIGFQAELQGRVSAGIVPQLRITSGPGKWMVYGIVGVPFVFAPLRLFGVETGPGILWRATRSFGLFFEVVLDIFFLGNDLPEDSIVLQIDGCFGVRISFL